MLFRITGDNGQDDFEEFNPDQLNHVPIMMESDTDYRKNYEEEWKKRNPGKDISELDPDEYKYMQVDNETRKIQYDLSVSVGAGLPNNKAYRYAVVTDMYKNKALSKREYRNYMIKALGMNFPEIPETDTEQQELQIFDEEKLQQMKQQAIEQQNMQSQMAGMNSNIEGLTANGNPAPSQLQGGLI